MKGVRMSSDQSSEVTEEVVIRDPKQVKLERKIRNAKISVWILAFLIAVNTVAALFIGQLYERPEFNDGRGEISGAMASYELNNANTRTVYNQMVVNGWVAKDLLEAIGKQNATMIEQNSEANWMLGWLLFNVLFTLGWLSIALIRIGLMQIEINQNRSNFV